MTKIEKFNDEKQVLAFVKNKVDFGGLIGDTGVTADVTGKKIIPAGTTVGGTTNFLQDETAVLTVVSDATAQGILEHAVDVTAGPADGSVIVAGYVNEFRLPEGVTIADEAKKALSKVTFVKRNK